MHTNTTRPFAFLVPIGVIIIVFVLAGWRTRPQEHPDTNIADTDLPIIPPPGYFGNPVDDVMRLTGTFGELRSDHFHSGIDVKSKTGGVGQPILAAADGYIDQIKVQTRGYGNVLYLKHPNGYTTVYAHLDEFSPEIKRYVREQQYRLERFEVSLQPTDGQFKVRKGQQIGTLGNSGGSTGPHLHFEVRQSTTGKALNPLLFSLPVADGTPPDIRDMKVYALDEKRQPFWSKGLPVVRGANGIYRPRQGDTIRLGTWRVGFGVKVYDQQDLLRNDNGIFSLQLQTDGQKAFECKMDGFDFDETRYLNAHTDYAAHQRFGAWFHRCFVLPGDKLSLYTPTETMGAVALFKEKPVHIRLQVKDAAGNASTVEFWALRDDNAAVSYTEPYQYEFAYQTENKLQLEDFFLNIGLGTLYEDLKFQYKTTPEQSPGFYSPVHHIHHEETPAHRYFDIGIAAYGLPEELRSKAVIARCTSGKPINCGGTWKDNKITTRIRNFGDYCIMADAVAPTVTPVGFDSDMRRKEAIVFRIDDNFATEAQADGLYYRGTVDGKWILFEYDYKRLRLVHTFDGHIGPGEHTLRLVVRDDRRNETIVERNFIR